MRLHTHKIKKLLLVVCIPCIISCTKNVSTTPSNAFITVINKTNSLASITINGKKFMVDENQNPLYTYYYMQVSAGSNSFTLLDWNTKKAVFDTNFVFLKDTYYTVVVYDSAQTVKTILIKDILPKPVRHKSYFRLLNLDRDAEQCTLSNKKGDVLSYTGIMSNLKEATSFNDIPSSANYSIAVPLKNGSNLVNDYMYSEVTDDITTILIYKHDVFTHDHFKL